MLRITLYAIISLCLFVTKMNAQETFENRAKKISENIKNISKEEKDALKLEVEKIDEMLEKGEISAEEAEAEKLKAAEVRAANIEARVAEEEAKLTTLIKDRIDGKVADNTESDSVYIGANKLKISWEKSTKEEKAKCEPKGERRTTSQFVLAFGLNTHISDGNLNSVDENGLRVWGSRFFEWGVSWNTRILKDHNLLHAKYGFSFMYNNVRTVNNLYYAKDGNQTYLQEFEKDLKSARFRNVQLVFPVHLEFDFTPKKVNDNGKTVFRTHESFRLGIGGFGGFNIRTEQILKYNEDDLRVKVRQRGDFNTPTFVYGLSAYVGHGETTFYVKYNLNPLFKDNPVEQNNLSLGVRWDFN